MHVMAPPIQEHFVCKFLFISTYQAFEWHLSDSLIFFHKDDQGLDLFCLVDPFSSFSGYTSGSDGWWAIWPSLRSLRHPWKLQASSSCSFLLCMVRPQNKWSKIPDKMQDYWFEERLEDFAIAPIAHVVHFHVRILYAERIWTSCTCICSMCNKGLRQWSLSFKSTFWLLVGDWLFFIQHLPCSVSIWCVHGSSVEV